MKFWEVEIHEIHLKLASFREKEVKSPRFGCKGKVVVCVHQT